MNNSKPPVPAFRTDKEAEDFVENADLTQFDLSGGQPVRYEFKTKDANISMRLPQQLLDAGWLEQPWPLGEVRKMEDGSPAWRLFFSAQPAPVDGGTP